MNKIKIIINWDSNPLSNRKAEQVIWMTTNEYQNGPILLNDLSVLEGMVITRVTKNKMNQVVIDVERKKLVEEVEKEQERERMKELDKKRNKGRQEILNRYNKYNDDGRTISSDFLDRVEKKDNNVVDN